MKRRSIDGAGGGGGGEAERPKVLRRSIDRGCGGGEETERPMEVSNTPAMMPDLVMEVLRRSVDGGEEEGLAMQESEATDKRSAEALPDLVMEVLDGVGDSGGGETERPVEVSETKEKRSEAAVPELGEDLVMEVLRRAEARTLGAAACVSRSWRRMAEDESVWEAVCTRHWAKLGCSPAQLRAVVLALGGFRRLHARYLRPLLQPSAAAASSSSASAAAVRRRHSRDELQVSLSLLSIGFFERMKPGGGGGGGKASTSAGD